ncbi:DUF945 family protein [Pigmentiphaga aceris]|uniref:DUF945 family protein n=1 Tax=Pigmentiphaga aceris TaxID=1940612 RepID=A0A5C0AY95_9BURK|nr:DUF945 family protein [Pigmentiphaga aceris]QEI06544.1 DUF945 family protein [Pigmentiphaga aceris]
MKKSVGIGAGVAVVVVVAGGWIGGAWYTGKRIEAESVKKLEEANAFLTAKYPYLGLKLVADRYERNLFSTNARYVLLGTMSPDAAKPNRLDIDARIDHGPFPSGALSSGHLAPHAAYVRAAISNTDVTKPVFDITKGVSPLTANALVSYSGNTAFDWLVPAIEHADGGRSLSFSGARGKGTFDRSTLAVNGDLRIDLLKFQGTEAEEKANVEIHGIGGKFDSRPGKFGISIGTGDMGFDRVVVTTKDPKQSGSIEKGNYRVKIDENDKFINVEAAYAVGAMKLGTVDLGSLQTTLKFAQLDGASLKVLSDFYAKLPATLSTTGSSSDDALKSGMTALMGSGQQLLAANPTFSIDPLSWKTDKGEHRASLSVQFDRFPVEQGFQPDTAIKAFKRVDASYTLSKTMAQDLVTKIMVEQMGESPADAQKTAAEQIEQVVAMAQMMNVGKVEGDNLVGRLSLVDGVVDVNGTKTPVEEFADQFGLRNSSFGSDDDSSDVEVDTVSPAMPSGYMNSVDTDVMGEILDDLGYAYTVDTDSAGDPKIVIEPGDLGAKSVEVEYYNCTGDSNQNCEDFLMKAVFKPSKGATLKVLNEFNRENRWVRVYLDDDNTAVVEMDVNADGGLGRESLKILVDLFFSVSGDFAEAIKPAAAPARR